MRIREAYRSPAAPPLAIGEALRRLLAGIAAETAMIATLIGTAAAVIALVSLVDAL